MVKKDSKSMPKTKKGKDKEEIHYHYHQGGPESTSPSKEVVEKGPHGKSIHHHYYYEPPTRTEYRSSKPGIAGSLLIIAGILGIVMAGAMFAGSVVFGNFEGMVENFSPTDPVDISGKVTFTNGDPVENATVSIIGHNLSTETDENGVYYMYNAPFGQQRIRVELDGYNTIIQKVYITPEERKSDWEGFSEEEDLGSKYNFVLTPGDDTIEKGSYPDWGFIEGILKVCGTVIIILSIITLTAGLFALKRKMFPFVVIGAVVGIFTMGFIIGTIMCIIALFILLLSKDEFKKN